MDLQVEASGSGTGLLGRNSSSSAASAASSAAAASAAAAAAASFCLFLSFLEKGFREM